MKLESQFEGARARRQASASPPFGPGFHPGIVGQIERLEIHITEFRDPAVSYCEFRAFDETGRLIGTQRIEGY